MNNIMYQQTILKHNRDPRNYGEIEDCSHYAEGINVLCGDDIQVYMQVNNDEINEIKFTGKGCAISQASASMMTTVLLGKKVDDALSYFDNFIKMVEGEDFKLEGEIVALAGISQFPSRVKCAVLSWQTFKAALEGSDNTISTE